MLLKEYHVGNGQGLLKDVLDLIDNKLQICNIKYKFRHVEVIRLINGNRVIVVNTLSKGIGLFYLLEITTDKVIKIYKFETLIDLDVYVLNRFWLNLNSYNFTDNVVKDVVSWDVSLIRNIIKKCYRQSNSCIYKFLEDREDIDLKNVEYYDSPYVRYGNIEKANRVLLELTKRDISKIYKVDDNKYLIHVDIDRYNYAVIINGDLYVSMFDFRLSSKFVNKYLNNIVDVLNTVINKSVDNVFNISTDYSNINVNKETSVGCIYNYINFSSLINGELNFSVK